MPPALTDDVWRLAQAGDRAAVDLVYLQLSPAVLGYLLARGAQDPEGLTSEVFLTVLSKLSVITGGVAGLRTFVFSVAHARMVDELRRRTRHPEAQQYQPDLDRRFAPSAEDVVIERDSRSRAALMLSRLGPDQAEVLTLRVLADLSIEQTAAVMGRSPGAVKQLQRRALLALRELLVDRGVTP